MRLVFVLYSCCWVAPLDFQCHFDSVRRLLQKNSFIGRMGDLVEGTAGLNLGADSDEDSGEVKVATKEVMRRCTVLRNL